MNLLVTGGYGFIGSNFVRHIVEKYPAYKIIILDKLTYAGNVKNLDGINKSKITERSWDICIPIDFLVDQSDVVINFAGETHVDRSITNSNEFIKTNVFGVVNIINTIKRYNKKLIHISTDEVYGPALAKSFDENDKLNPGNPYSASKASADMFIKSYINTYNIQAMIVRPSNNYGPRQYPEKLIPLFIKKLLNNEKVPVYGNGMQIREWTYVEDTCKAIDCLLHNGRYGEIYNVTSEFHITNLQVVKCLLELLNKPGDLIEYVEDRPGHDVKYSINCDKIKIECGWSVQQEFKTGLISTVNWYLNQIGEIKC